MEKQTNESLEILVALVQVQALFNGLTLRKEQQTALRRRFDKSPAAQTSARLVPLRCAVGYGGNLYSNGMIRA